MCVLSRESHDVVTPRPCLCPCRAAAQVRVHMSSVNAGLFAPSSPPCRQQAPRPCPLMIFEEVTRNESQLTVRQCTAVNAHVCPHATRWLSAVCSPPLSLGLPHVANKAAPRNLRPPPPRLFCAPACGCQHTSVPPPVCNRVSAAEWHTDVALSGSSSSSADSHVVWVCAAWRS